MLATMECEIVMVRDITHKNDEGNPSIVMFEYIIMYDSTIELLKLTIKCHDAT